MIVMRNNSNLKFIACLLVSFGTTLTTFAQDATSAASNAGTDSNNGLFWGLGTAILFAALLIAYLMGRMGHMLSENKPAAEGAKGGWWSMLDKEIFTKAIPLEKEADHLLDHDYDGIQELDNSLPPWWKYGFYFTIVFAVFYILRYHVWKTGPDPEQEYKTEMAVATKQIEEYRKKAGDMVDEKTVTMADAAGIAEGDKIFHSNCFACHGGKGEGGVGPNLTDNYWLHGGTINDVFKTIKYGVAEKGMQAWEKTYSPSQIKSLASYIKTLAGTNPPNPKAPQGDLFQEKATDAKPAAAKDSSVAKK